MFNKFFFICFSMSFLAASCSSKKVNDNVGYTEILIDNSKIEVTEDISDKIDNISILLLKETKGNYMADISKLAVLPNKTYIAYDQQSKKINIFDSVGVFVKTLSQVGDSPNDPLNITDFWVNNLNEVEVYDFAQMKIFLYDTSFTLKKINKSPQFNHFTALKRIPNQENYIGYANFNTYNEPYKGKLYHVCVLDKNLNIIQADKYFDKMFQGINWLSYPEHFYQYKDTLRFVQSYDNFIYNATSSGVKERYKIVYKKDPLPDDVMSIVEDHLNKFKDINLIDPNELAAYFKNYTRFYGGWFENDDYIYLSSIDAEGKFGQLFYSLIDKKDNSTIFNAKSFCETKKYRLTFPPFGFYDRESKEYIGIANGELLKSMLHQDSPFQQVVIGDPELIYLVKVKFNEKK